MCVLLSTKPSTSAYCRGAPHRWGMWRCRVSERSPSRVHESSSTWWPAPQQSVCRPCAVRVCACARTRRARYAETDDGARRTVFEFFFPPLLHGFFHYRSSPPRTYPPPHRRPDAGPRPPFRSARRSEPRAAHAPRPGAAFSSAAAAAQQPQPMIFPAYHLSIIIHARAHTHTCTVFFSSRRAHTVHVCTYTFVCTG